MFPWLVFLILNVLLTVKIQLVEKAKSERHLLLHQFYSPEVTPVYFLHVSLDIIHAPTHTHEHTDIYAYHYISCMCPLAYGP